ncbi:MAG TPA: 3-oxoacyl-[acyl-carrier-protein] synthase III C-terminal domain-containing protein, partial [Candidatus Binataceae bacterium]
NIRIINAVAQRLGLPPEKVFTNIGTYGNTSAASVPIALDEAVEMGRIHDNDLVMLNACGGGLTWGANLVRW